MKKTVISFFIFLTISFFATIFLIGAIGISNDKGGHQLSPDDLQLLKQSMPVIVGCTIVSYIPTIALFIRWMIKIREKHSDKTTQYSVRKIFKVFSIIFAIIAAYLGLLVLALILEINNAPEDVDPNRLAMFKQTLLIISIATGVFAILSISFLIYVIKTKKQVKEENMIKRATYFAKKRKLCLTIGIPGCLITGAFGSFFLRQMAIGLMFTAGEKTKLAPEVRNQIILTGAFVIAFIIFLIVLIIGLTTKVAKSNAIKYNYKTKEYYVDCPNVDGVFDGESICALFNDAHNLGYTKFIRFTGSQMIFKTDLTLKELEDQNNRVDKYNNGVKDILKEMPSYFKKNGRIYSTLEEEFYKSSTVDVPIYETVNDYDEVTYEDGIEVSRESHYENVFTGKYSTETINTYKYTLRFFEKSSKKPVLDEDGNEFIIFWFKSK